VATSVVIVSRLFNLCRHRQRVELVAVSPTSSRPALGSALVTASTRRPVRQNGERNDMSTSPATGHADVTPVTIANRTVLVTGANRGIGRALVEEALARGAKRVYAGTRQALAHPDRRVTALTFDLTDAAQVRAAADQVESLDILINNAGVAQYDDLSDRSAIEHHLAVNFFGTYTVTQAFLPQLIRSRGAIVNVLSTAALASIPVIPAYSISKAAAFSLSQSLRALLAGQGVRVHAIMTGPTDTDMSRGLDVPKASPESVARAIFDGVEGGEEETFPDPMSAALTPSWNGGAVKAMERQNAGLVAPEPVAS
jgi:NAD(P)-dependent dehydrogenase (short-subunit alcohol dehydrogenase family)